MDGLAAQGELSVEQLFRHGANEIRLAAGELWPDQPVRLGAHVPSVTCYVRRIVVGQRSLYAKYSYLGASLVSVLAGKFGGWDDVHAAQRAYVAASKSLLMREAAQLDLLSRLDRPRVCAVAGCHQGVLFTEAARGASLAQLLYAQPTRTAELLGRTWVEVQELHQPQLTQRCARTTVIEERSIAGVFVRKFSGSGAAHYLGSLRGHRHGSAVLSPPRARAQRVVTRLRQLWLASSATTPTVLVYAAAAQPRHSRPVCSWEAVGTRGQAQHCAGVRYRPVYRVAAGPDRGPTPPTSGSAAMRGSPLSAPAVGSIGLVGAGAVGQAVGTAVVATRLSEQLLIASRTREQALALATDLDDMRLAVSSTVRPRAASVAELRRCHAVVVAVRARFTNTNCTNVRMGGLAANAPVIRQLAGEFSDYRGVVIMVTNPVDLMSRLFAEVSGSHVVGIGSNLDSARYRLILAGLFEVPPQQVSGSVIGEHGDALVICSSATTVNGQAVHVPVDRVRAALLDRPGMISNGIGRARAGPAGAVLSTLCKFLGLTDGVEELSSPYRGAWLGVPVGFTTGHTQVQLPPLDPQETRQLAAAAATLSAAYAALAEQLALPVSSPEHPPRTGMTRFDGRS